MGCLISKPVFKLVYTKNNLEFEFKSQDSLELTTPKIVVDLFYFVLIIKILLQ